MAGLGLGSHAGGLASERLGRTGALRVFGFLELGIGVFGVLSVPLYYDWLSSHGAALYAIPWRAGLLHFASLLPPTCLMGMSLPFLVRAMVDEVPAAGRTIGLLYGINMLGASLGAVLTPWVLVRFLGLQGAVLVAAAGNALAGLTALGLVRFLAPSGAGSPEDLGEAPREPLAEAPPSADPALPGADEASRSRGLPTLWTLLYALSGFCALSLEILWFRLLDVATRSTTFSFGTLLALYLLGSAAGCFAGARWSERIAHPLRTFLTCQCALLAYSGLAVLLLVVLPPETPVLVRLSDYWRGGGSFPLGGSGSLPLLVALYVFLPAFLFGLPTALMGFSFPVLQRAVQDDPRTSGRKVGLLQAANIAGCVLGSLLIGLVALDRLGTTGSLRLLLALGLVFAALGLGKYGTRTRFAPLFALLLALAAVLPSQDRLWRRLHGTANERALIAEDATGLAAILPRTHDWHVVVNGKHHSRLPFGGIHTRLGAIPALVHPAPLDVAIIGLGSGDTAWAAGCRRETRSVTVFEISGSQHRLLWSIAKREPLMDLRRFLADPRLDVRLADGRHAIAHGAARYDLIEADALWPYAAYSGNLYSVEFFAECARRLKPGGILCTWTPTPRILASFRTVFRHVAGPGRQIFLLGSNEPFVEDKGAWMARLAEAADYLGGERAEEVRTSLAKVVVFDESDPPLEGALNRDLFPRDEFNSP
jgi:spermidine synthase